ncbi:MAG: pilin [Patescibacteria group bacterium]
MPYQKKLFVILLPVFLITILFFKPVEVKAQAATETFIKEIPLQVPIYGFTEPCQTEPYKSQGKYCVNDIGEYISQFYKYFAGAAGILATVMILFSGFQWVTASGNASRIEKAKSTMNGALIGLVLTLTSYVLLRTINPDLVSFNSLYLTPVKSEYLSAVFCRQFTLDKLAIYDEYQKAGVTLTKDSPALDCGKILQFKDGSGECLGHYCSVTGEVCGPNFDNDTFNCQNAKELCENTEPGKCQQIDDVFSKAGGYPSYICRQIDRTTKLKMIATSWMPTIGYPDKCYFGYLMDPNILKTCGSSTKLRISCQYGGSNNDSETACWDKGEPKEIESDVPYTGKIVKMTFPCNDTNRVGFGLDAVCCASISKSDIVCSLVACNLIPKFNYEEVSCNDAILGLSTGFNNMPGNYKTGQASCSNKCCVPLDLTMVNFQ